jgi:hypothetical protein
MWGSREVGTEWRKIRRIARDSDGSPIGRRDGILA